MTSTTFGRLGPLYKIIGLATAPELVSARKSSAEKAIKGVDATALPSLVCAALRVGKADGLVDFVAHFRSDDPLFDPQPGDKEVAALASATLSEILDSNKALAPQLALMIVAAGFGGVRTYLDPDIYDQANKVLVNAQQGARPQALAEVTYTPKPKLKDEYAGLETQGKANQFGAGYPHIKALLDGSFVYSENGLKHLAGQLSRVIENQQRLEEEMAIHWWIVGGWSIERNTLFADLELAEATIRTARELANLTKSVVGLSSSPAMLDLVLKSGRSKAAKPMALAKIVTASPIDWRKSWSSNLTENASMSGLAPMSMAVALSVDSDDADDWKPRFQRATGIAPETEIAALDAALQMYRECILLRSLA